MPKNIYLPKENLPKIVEVREIESEIPSYEEFLKNYQQEKANKVNYNDLTYKDISSSKSYGPMWGSSQYGERWTDLRIPCPVRDCSNTIITNQTHTCGGQIKISNQAWVKCQSCGITSHVMNWKFNCSSHSSSYQATASTNINSFENALVTAFNNGSMERGIVMELLQSLRNSR